MSNGGVRRSRVAGVAAAALGVVLVGTLAVVALRRQAAIARRRIGKPHGELAPGADRVWRRKLDGEALQLLVLGDSVAAGLGVERRKDTPGARIARGLAARTGRPVRLRTGAVVGSESSALAGQLAGLPTDYRPDIAVIVVGGNDVTHRIPIAVATGHLRAAIDRLVSNGAVVVVGTCPDLGALRAVPQPLRSLLARWSRRLCCKDWRQSEVGCRSAPIRRLLRNGG